MSDGGFCHYCRRATCVCKYHRNGGVMPNNGIDDYWDVANPKATGTGKRRQSKTTSAAKPSRVRVRARKRR